MNPASQFGQEAIANMEIEMMTDLYNRYVVKFLAVSQLQGRNCTRTYPSTHASFFFLQVVKDVPQEVYPSQVSRGGPQQRRSHLHRPLCGEVHGSPRSDWKKTNQHVHPRPGSSSPAATGTQIARPQIHAHATVYNNIHKVTSHVIL